MATTLTLDARIDAATRLRRHGWRVRGLIYAALGAAFLWCFYTIVVADTDWPRLMGTSFARTLGHFLEFDVSLLSELVDPAIDTALMATVATLLGLVLALPVAWLGASNITPLGRFT